MKSVIFIFQRNIFPKTSGYPLRASRWLEAFVGKATIHVVFVNAREINPGTEDYLRALGVNSFKHFHISPIRGALHSLWFFFTRGMPLQAGFYSSYRVRNHLKSLQEFDLALFSERRVGDYMRFVRAKNQWIDLCDLVDDNYRTGASRMPLSMYKAYYTLEWPLLKRWDRKLALKADRAYLVTEYFARMMARRLNGEAKGRKVVAIENGVNIELAPASEKGRNGYYFIGPLSYKPNYDAVMWFLDEVHPFIKGDFRGKVIGTYAPTKLIQRLYEAGIEYKPFAEDLSSELTEYGICLAPMISGGGLLNKCLEAFHSGRIVLLSPRASTGFKNIQNGVHAIVCDKAEAWLQAFDDIDSGRYDWQPEQIKHLVKDYSWDRFHQEADDFLQ